MNKQPRCRVKNRHFTSSQRQPSAQQVSGFTLVEVMIVLAVMGMIAAIAVPSFKSIINTNSLATQANDLVGALNYARSEAVKRRQTVTLTSNNGNNWKDGWAIALADGTLLRNYDALKGNTTLTTTTGTIQYLSSGFTNNAANVTFTLCVNSGEAGRQVQLSPIGRPHTDTDFVCP